MNNKIKQHTTPKQFILCEQIRSDVNISLPTDMIEYGGDVIADWCLNYEVNKSIDREWRALFAVCRTIAERLHKNCCGIRLIAPNNTDIVIDVTNNKIYPYKKGCERFGIVGRSHMTYEQQLSAIDFKINKLQERKQVIEEKILRRENGKTK